MRLGDLDVLKEMLIKERDAIPLTKTERYSFGVGLPNSHGMSMRGGINKAFRCMEKVPTVDAVPVVHGYHEGDVCIYGFGHENKSRAVVEIVRILNDARGVAEVKFHKVFVDDTGNGFFDYLLKSGGTMNASFKYLKNITPRMDGDSDEG